jgi:hypothetical protein
LTCDRILQEPFHFCCLSCKVQYYYIPPHHPYKCTRMHATPYKVPKNLLHAHARDHMQLLATSVVIG